MRRPPARSTRKFVALLATALAGHLSSAPAVYAQDVNQRGDSVTIRLIDVDLRAAVQALARYLDKPILFGQVTTTRVTLETPRPVAVADVPQLLRRLVESQNLELITDAGGAYVVRQKEQPRTPTPADVARQQQQQQGPPELFVIRLRHARAADVAATVNSLYGRASAVGEVGSRGRTLGDQLTSIQVPSTVAPTAQAAPQPGAPLSNRPAVLTGDVTIVPDQGTNSLLIRSTRSDFDLISAAVTQLDVRPLQVLIEVLIAEIRRDRSLSFGVDASLPATSIGKGNASVEGGLTTSSIGDLVVKMLGLGSADIDATIRAAASRGDITIVSRPVVIAANNQEAEILVGSQRPFVQVSRSLPTDAASRDQIVQYKDVGTKLRVLPTISADGYVMLQVTQEVNTATTETQFNAPVISTRSVQTELLIKSGQTVALGGLTDRQRDRTQSGIPVLSSIPLVGGLFGQTTRKSNETELFLFLTPRVIASDAEAQQLTEPMQKRAEKANP